MAVVNGEDPAESEVINGEEDNGTEQVPTAITDTIPVFQDNVKDTVVKDELLERGGDLHAAVRPGLQGRGHPVATDSLRREERRG